MVAGGGGLVLPGRGDHAGEDDDGAEDQGDSGDDAAEAAGVGEHGVASYGRVRHPSSPGAAIRGPPRGGRARSSARPMERRARARYLGATVRLEPRPTDRPRDRAPDPPARRRRGAGARQHRPLADRRAVNGAALAFRRRSPLIALVAVVAVQGLAHDATYDTDPLSPFLAELILMFTVAYQLRLKLGAARLRDRRRLRGRSTSAQRPHRRVRAGRRAGRLLPARVGDRPDRARARRSAAARPSATSCAWSSSARSRPAPRSPTSARGSRASCTTPSRTACR